MVAHTQSIHILDPCPEESPEVRGTSAALAGIAGKVIGLLENRKYHADAFLQELHKVLEQEYGVKRVVYATKVGGHNCQAARIKALAPREISRCHAMEQGQLVHKDRTEGKTAGGYQAAGGHLTMASKILELLIEILNRDRAGFMQDPADFHPSSVCGYALLWV